MQANDIGVVSYLVAAGAFLLLALLLLTSWRGRLQGATLVIAVVTSTVWAIVGALGPRWQTPAAPVAYHTLEVLRDITWYLFLFRLLRPLKLPEQGASRILRIAEPAVIVLGLAVLVVDLFPSLVAPLLSFPSQGPIVGHLLLALVGLALVEQLFRNTRPSGRWSVKYLFLGVGAIFAYDFFLFADALLFKQIDLDLWVARGFVNALAVPMLAVSAARNPAWSLDVFVSRRVVFHTVTLAGAGIYLLVMAAAGYYIRQFGGSWGTAAQAAFLAFALVLLVVLLFSGQMRAKLKVFLSKHFFNYKYDYREEWLKLSRQLLAGDDELNPRQRAIRSLADIVESTGGMLWTRTEADHYVGTEHWNMNEIGQGVINDDAPLIEFLRRRQWVIDLDEYSENPELYDDLILPRWLQELPRAWLVVPLMRDDTLIAFVVLGRPRALRSLNWEDRDLLKTVGLQIASYIALVETGEALMNARQFEAFNRLSSYVVHDLKNVSAQLSLVVQNAKRHLDNPEFVADAIRTVENATGKMNRMLAQLRKGGTVEAAKSIVELKPILDDAVATCSGREPVPELEVDGDGLMLVIDAERLTNVLSHLIQNAQESTSRKGRVKVCAHRQHDDVVIEVQDDGCGMDDQFIRERLFRPFDTTKGNAGMGIGVYESREFIWSQGGDLLVSSETGKGSTFRVRLPLYRDAPGHDQRVAGAVH